MTQSFDDYLKNNNPINGNYSAQDLFKAGAQSRQAEIDGLGALSEMSEQKIDDLVLRNIKLQKRIDEALKEIESGITGKHHVSYIAKILKGESND